MTDIQFSIVPCPNQIQPEVREVWERLFHHHPAAPIFQHPEWTAIATRTGLVTGLTNIIFSLHQHPVAMLSIHRRTAWTAEVIAPEAVDYPAWLVEPDSEEAALTGLIRWFKEASHLRLLSLGRYCDPERVAHYSEYAAQHGLALCAQPVDPVNVLSLPTCWQAYEKNLGKTTRRNMHHTENRIHRDFPDFTITILTAGDPWNEALETLMRHSFLRWQHHPANVFAQSRKRLFIRESMRWAINEGYATVHQLSVNGTQIAAATILRYPRQDIAHHFLLGRDPSPAYQHYRAGIVLHCHTIRWCIDQGLRELRMGQGHFAYKTEFGAHEQPQWELFLAHSPQQALYWRKIDAAIQMARSLPNAISFQLQRWQPPQAALQQFNDAPQPVKQHDKVILR